MSPKGGQFEAQRGITIGPSVREYPGSKWENIAGYLIDKRRQELFTGEETHFVNRYYLTLTHQLHSGIYAKTNSLLYKKGESALEGEGYFDLEVCRKEIQEFRDESDACVSHLIGRIYIAPLTNDQCASYIHTSVSSNFHPLEEKVELATDQYSFGYYTANNMVWDTKYHAAIEKARYMAGLVNSCGFNAKVETSNAFNAFFSMQPGNAYANVRRPVISSGNLSHVIPLSSLWSGMAHNDWTKECFDCASPLLICSTSSKIAFFLNLNVGDLGHTFVFGPAGAGKSTLLCLMESQFLKYRNANVIILDKDKSARSITMAAGGVYAEPGGEDTAFQPLRDLETETDLSWAAEFIKLLLEMQGITCDAVMSEAIAAALKQIRSGKAPERRTLSTFQQYVNYTSPKTGLNEIRIGIQPYTINGEYGRIFDAGDTRLALSKWVMIEMGTLMKMGQAAVTPALMFLFRFIEKMYTKPNGDPTGDPTLLVLDEAWVFLDNDYFARKIEEWLVTLRKKRVFCVFATQEVSKAANSKLRTTIVSQCLTKIYLADPNAQSAIVAEYYRVFGLEDHEIAALAHGRMKRDYFYKSPKGARLFELGLDEFQLALLTPDHALLDELEEEYGKNNRKPLALEILKRKGVQGYQQYV